MSRESSNAKPAEAISGECTNSHSSNGLSAVPQWKQEFLAKKRALRDHQWNHNQRLLNTNVGNNPTSSFSGDVDSDFRKDDKKPTTDENITFATSNNGALIDLTSNQPIVIDGKSGDKNIDNDTDNENSETDSDCSSEEDFGISTSETHNKKAGGYSFITGERLGANASDVEDSSEESKSSTADSDTEGSAEFKYKPGFVSRLLNKFSTISYQGEPLNNGLPSYKADGYERPPIEGASSMKPSNGSAPLHLSNKPPKSMAAHDLSTHSSKDATPLTSPTHVLTAIKTSLDSTSAETTASVEPKLSMQSYRAPKEIILIEGPHEKATNEPKMMHSASSTDTSPKPDEPICTDPDRKE